jgi:HEAT repeat protein
MRLPQYTLLTYSIIAIIGDSPSPRAAGDENKPLSVPAVINELHDPRSNVRRQALWRALDLGQNAVKAIPAVLAALDDPDEEVRAVASVVLARAGPQVARGLIAALKSGKPRMQVAACKAIALGAEGSGFQPPLLKLLRAPDASVRSGTVDALARLHDPLVIPALLTLFRQESDVQVRSATINAFISFGAKAAPATPDLLRILEGEPDRALQLLSVDALVVIGPAVLPFLLPELKARKQPAIRRVTLAEVVSRIARKSQGKGMEGSLLLMLSCLDDNDDRVRWNIAEALGLVGREATVALAKLRKLLKYGAEIELVVVALAMYRIDPTNRETMPTLSDALLNGAPNIKIAAADAAKAIGPAAAELLPALLKASRHSAPGVRRGSIEAIKVVAPDVKAAAQRLLEMVEDPDPHVRAAAKSAVRRSDSKHHVPGGK